MVTAVIVVLDEARDLGFEITGQVIVLEQNAVLEGLVPASTGITALETVASKKDRRLGWEGPWPRERLRGV